MTDELIAGEPINRGDAVYKGSDGKFYLLDREPYRIELESDRALEIGHVYRLQEVNQKIIVGGEVIEARPGENGRTIYLFDMSARKFDAETRRPRTFELMS